MSRPHMGASPRGATITSGTVSAGTAITAGHIDIDGHQFPGLAVAANAEARVDQIVALLNAAFSITGVWAEKVTASTYKLSASKTITATLGASCTVATFGFLTSISDPVDGAVHLAAGNRKAHGSGVSTDDTAYIEYGNQDVNVKHAKAMGLLGYVDGIDIEYTPAASPTITTH